jgi:hypothetical protein
MRSDCATVLGELSSALAAVLCSPAYNHSMERKIFWASFIVLGLVADFLLPFWWAFAATIPILFASWWIAYRSDWF